MKKILTICLLLATAFTIQAQEKQTEVCDCPAPQKVDYAKICSYTKDKKHSSEESELNFLFEQQMIKMSCAVEGKDSPEVIRIKVNKMWNKYRTNFACDSLGFNVPNGNVLKFTMNFNFPEFIYYMIDNYDLDMDFKDPADNKTIIEYLNEELAKTKKYGSGKIIEMTEVKTALEEQKARKQKLVNKK